jgi:hypothetical protein
MEIASIMAGLKTKTFVTREGVSETVTLMDYPEWVKDIMASHTRHNFVGQSWSIT